LLQFSFEENGQHGLAIDVVSPFARGSFFSSETASWLAHGSGPQNRETRGCRYLCHSHNTSGINHTQTTQQTMLNKVFRQRVLLCLYNEGFDGLLN